MNLPTTHTYRKRNKRLTAAIKSLHPLQAHASGEQKRAIAYFLDTNTVDETRRARSERPTADKPSDDAAPKTSGTY